MKITAHSYQRFSTPEQAQGDSDRRQLAAFDSYCERNGRIKGDLVYRDAGVSGYTGKHAITGDLSRFLDAVKRGIVKPGHELVIENFDRLSRQPQMDAMDLLSGITRAGIIIVTLTDGRRYSRENLNEDLSHLMNAVLEISRSHGESKRKSGTVGNAWGEKEESRPRQKTTVGLDGAGLATTHRQAQG